MRNPTAVKIADEGVDGKERIYYFHERDRVIVVEFKSEKGNNVYKENSTCFRVTSPNPWDYWDHNIPGEPLQTP